MNAGADVEQANPAADCASLWASGQVFARDDPTLQGRFTLGDGRVIAALLPAALDHKRAQQLEPVLAWLGIERARHIQRGLIARTLFHAAYAVSAGMRTDDCIRLAREPAHPQDANAIRLGCQGYLLGSGSSAECRERERVRSSCLARVSIDGRQGHRLDYEIARVAGHTTLPSARSTSATRHPR